MSTIWMNWRPITSFFNNRIPACHATQPLIKDASWLERSIMAFPRTSSKALRAGRTAESRITNSYESMRRSSRLNSLFSFVTRHSLIVIRLLLHRQFKLPILQKELSGHGNSDLWRVILHPCPGKLQLQKDPGGAKPSPLLPCTVVALDDHTERALVDLPRPWRPGSHSWRGGRE